jgi:class 3 adenylate cyclase
MGALDYFAAKHLEYEKIQAIASARHKILRFDHLLNVKTFFESKKQPLINEFGKLRKPESSSLQEVIRKNAEVLPVFSVFKIKDSDKIISLKSLREDIKHCTMPSKILFRRIFLELAMKDPEKIRENERLVKGNRLQLQQMFKLITTNTILKNSVLQNFSVYLGGEVYFLILEMPKDSMISHAILLFRGKDIASERIVSFAMSEVDNTQVILRKTDFSGNTTDPGKFNSKVLYDNQGITVTYPANQYFIRHYLHNGCTEIKRNLEKLPYIRHRIRFSRLQSEPMRMRKAIRVAILTIIMIFSAAFFRFAFFGIELARSLKKRILAGMFAAAIFPVGTLSLCLYLYQSFDDYLYQLNLIQHIEMKIAQNFERLVQRTEQIEMFMNKNPQILEKFQNISEADFQKMALKISRILPVSEISYITEDNSFNRPFPERRSIFVMNAEDPIWSFMPKHVLRWEKEDGRKNRQPQHYFDVAGQKVKATFFNETMIQYGAFYLISQGAVPLWVSSIRVADPKEPRKIFGILHFKYELGPILKDYYEKNAESENLFFEELGNHKIYYGYFPLKKISNNDFWQGSHDNQHRQIFSNFLQNNRNQDILKSDGKMTFIRTNQGFKHKVIAIAERKEQGRSLKWSNLFYSGFLFILLVLLFASQLLDHFFVLPINNMAQCAEKIARGGVEWNLKLSTNDELDELNMNFASMVNGLRQRNALKEFVSEDAFAEIEETHELELYPGGEYQEASIVFAAINLESGKNATSINDSEKNMQRMDLFLSICDQISKRNSGMVDKIVEDTIMLVFRGKSGINHSLNAATTALQIKERAEESGLKLKIGISSGQVISGRIGSYTGKLDFTVIGDTVNLAARLKNEAGESSTGIILSGSAMRQLKGKARVNFLRRSSIKGKSREFNIYELVDLR